MAWRSCHSGLDQLSWSHPSTWLQSKAGEQGERSWSDSRGYVGIHRPGLSPTQGFSRESSPSAPLQPMPLLSHSTSVPRATEGKVLGDPHEVSMDLGTEAPGEAWQSLASAMAALPASQDIPDPSLPACHTEGSAQKQPASLWRKAASVSIATARDGGCCVPCPCELEQDTGAALCSCSPWQCGETKGQLV